MDEDIPYDRRPSMDYDYDVLDKLRKALEPFSLLARNLDAGLELCKIWNRSTESIIETITELCNELESTCRNNRIPMRQLQAGDLLRSRESELLYRLLLFNTSFRHHNQLADEPNSSHFIGEIPLISISLLLELLLHVGYEPLLVDSFIYLPLDVCVELLQEIPRTIMYFDFNLGLSLVKRIIVKAHRKLVNLKYVGSSVFGDTVETAWSFVNATIELINIFKNERFLRYDDLNQESDKYARMGQVLKALMQIGLGSFNLKAMNEPDRLEERYRLETFTPLLLSPETCDCMKKELDDQLISLLLEKTKQIDVYCYMEWSDIRDEDSGYTLQKSIGMDCKHFLELGEKSFSDHERFKELSQALVQMKTDEDPPPKDREVDRQNSILSLVKHMLEDSSVEWERESFNEYGTTIRGLLQSVPDVGRLIEVLQMLGNKIDKQREERITELDNTILISNENGTKTFAEDHPLRLLLRDPEVYVKAEYVQFLVQLFFHPRKTIELILKLAIGHAAFDPTYMTFENIDYVLHVLKLSESNACNELLSKLMDEAKFSVEEKETVKNFRKECTDKSVPLVLQILQKIAIEDFSSINPHLSVCLNALKRNYIVDDKLLFNELLLPLLLLPSCRLSPILEYFESSAKTCKDYHGPLYRLLLKRSVMTLSRDQTTNRYLVSEQLSKVHQLYERAFDEQLCQSFNVKRQQLVYQYRAKLNGCGGAEYSIERLTEDMLRHEFLQASQWDCLALAEDLLVNQGYSVGRPCSNRAETFDLLIRLLFETCLIALEFPSFTTPKSALFILELLGVILSFAKSKDVVQVIASLSQHATIIQSSIKRTPLRENYEKLLESWQYQSTSREAPSLKDSIRSLGGFVNKAAELDNGLIVTPGAITPLATKLYLAEKTLQYVSSTKDIGSLLSKKINDCLHHSKHR